MSEGIWAMRKLRTKRVRETPLSDLFLGLFPPAGFEVGVGLHSKRSVVDAADAREGPWGQYAGRPICGPLLSACA